MPGGRAPNLTPGGWCSVPATRGAPRSFMQLTGWPTLPQPAPRTHTARTRHAHGTHTAHTRHAHGTHMARPCRQPPAASQPQTTARTAAGEREITRRPGAPGKQGKRTGTKRPSERRACVHRETARQLSTTRARGCAGCRVGVAWRPRTSLAERASTDTVTSRPKPGNDSAAPPTRVEEATAIAHTLGRAPHPHPHPPPGKHTHTHTHTRARARARARTNAEQDCAQEKTASRSAPGQR